MNFSIHKYRRYHINSKNGDDGFFEITKLDEENTIVEGKFKVEFEVDSKNSFIDSGLPEKVKFQGVFHETYIKG